MDVELAALAAAALLLTASAVLAGIGALQRSREAMAERRAGSTDGRAAVDPRVAALHGAGALLPEPVPQDAGPDESRTSGDGAPAWVTRLDAHIPVAVTPVGLPDVRRERDDEDERTRRAQAGSRAR